MTYNPDYTNRNTIPKKLLNIFRSVAMVNTDLKVICKLLLFSNGFKNADNLSDKLTKIF